MASENQMQKVGAVGWLRARAQVSPSGLLLARSPLFGCWKLSPAPLQWCRKGHPGSLSPLSYHCSAPWACDLDSQPPPSQLSIRDAASTHTALSASYSVLQSDEAVVRGCPGTWWQGPEYVHPSAHLQRQEEKDWGYRDQKISEPSLHLNTGARASFHWTSQVIEFRLD